MQSSMYMSLIEMFSFVFLQQETKGHPTLRKAYSMKVENQV